MAEVVGLAIPQALLGLIEATAKVITYVRAVADGTRPDAELLLY